MTTKEQQQQQQGGLTHNTDESPCKKHRTEVDPFPFALRCRPSSNNKQTAVLWWRSYGRPIKVEDEQELVEHYLIQYGRKERGMFNKQPYRRLKALRNHVRSKNIDLLTALSLRRHHMKKLNPGLPMDQLGLGKVHDINQSAAIFETCVADHLTAHHIQCYGENEQRRHIQQHRKDDQPHPPTPDFILHEPLCIKVYRLGKDRNQRRVLHERTVHWLEVKMYYGASTIPFDGKSAVGSLLHTAKKYNRVYGPGAMVFLNGYGEELFRQLSDQGVLVLDARGVIDTKAVQKHQRTWCADKNGCILP